jgi:hypothetical protein
VGGGRDLRYAYCGSSASTRRPLGGPLLDGGGSLVDPGEGGRDPRDSVPEDEPRVGDTAVGGSRCKRAVTGEQALEVAPDGGESSEEQLRNEVRQIVRTLSPSREWRLLLLEFVTYAARNPKFRARFVAGRRKFKAALTKALEQRIAALGDSRACLLWRRRTLSRSRTSAVSRSASRSGCRVRSGTQHEIFALAARGKAIHPTARSMAAFYAFPGLVYRPIVDMSPLPLGLIWVTAHENGRIRAFADAGPASGGNAGSGERGRARGGISAEIAASSSARGAG